MQHDTLRPLSEINGKAVAKYALLPGILPRLMRLAQNLSQFMFLFTQILGAAGLINKNHPCLKAENIGRYRFSDVIGLAAENVVFDRKHIPQIVMFSMVICTLVLTAAIFLALIANLLLNVQAAHAQYFSTPVSINSVSYTESGDWALQFLSRIFGANDFFPAAPGGNMWFTTLLTGMLKHYSLAMLVVGAFMMLYLLLMTLTEAAQTGKPFGTKFDGIWAPVRLALAIGMLIPISSQGYNGAQLITFQAAVWGSNLATNSWLSSMENLNTESKNFFAASMTDHGYSFARDMFLVNLCVEGIRALGNKNYGSGKVFFKGSESGDYYTFSFGTSDAPDFCGQVRVMRKIPDSALPAGLTSTSWPIKVVNTYWEIARDFMPIPGDTNPGIRVSNVPVGGGYAGPAATLQYPVGQAIAPAIMQPYVPSIAKQIIVKEKEDFTAEASELNMDGLVAKWITESYWKPLGRSANIGSRFFQETPYGCGASVSSCNSGLIADFNKWLMDSLMKDAEHGWTTAGVFYLRMSNALSLISKVVNNPPKVIRLPSNLSKAYSTPDNPRASTEQIRDYCSGVWESLKSFFHAGAESCRKYELSVKINSFLNAGDTWFRSSPTPADLSVFGAAEFKNALELPEPAVPVNPDTNLITQPIINGLYDFAQISSGDLNPLGAVISWGHMMMNIGGVAAALSFLPGGLGDLSSTVAALFFIPGFILAFYVPMLPFLYFTFAVMEWMISILEAVIGMPLWALSLITLKGDGLGQIGMAGVKRLFEIVLRPTVIVMALLCSLILFTAAVGFFNEMMNLFSSNAGVGSNANFFTTAIGGFGMVFLYVFGVYSIATSSFKLIDQIPNNFYRWGGLEKGFGAMIKFGTGTLSDITQAVIAGTVFNSVTSVGRSVKKLYDK